MATVQLIGIGHYPAKPASKLEVGDVIVWNYGSKSTVTAFIKETAKQIIFEVADEHGVHQRRFGKDRLVACQKILAEELAERRRQRKEEQRIGKRGM